jgi:hypothetical protein
VAACSRCDALGRIVCFRCSGVGYKYEPSPTFSPCVFCHGKGCDMCLGTGGGRPLAKTTCPLCNRGMVQCPVCYGTGRAQ